MRPAGEQALRAVIQLWHSAAAHRPAPGGLRVPDGGRAGVPLQPSVVVAAGRVLHRGQQGGKGGTAAADRLSTSI